MTLIAHNRFLDSIIAEGYEIGFNTHDDKFARIRLFRGSEQICSNSEMFMYYYGDPVEVIQVAGNDITYSVFIKNFSAR